MNNIERHARIIDTTHPGLIAPITKTVTSLYRFAIPFRFRSCTRTPKMPLQAHFREKGELPSRRATLLRSSLPPSVSSVQRSYPNLPRETIKKQKCCFFFSFALCSALHAYKGFAFFCLQDQEIENPLCLLLALLHVLVAEEGQGAADQDHGVEADAHAGLAGAGAAGLRGGGLLDFGGRVVGLVGGMLAWSYCVRAVGRMFGRKRTPRLTVPTRRPSRISRASSLWPTSSNASVESWPPTSSITSSPPGCSSTKPVGARERLVSLSLR
jgi:hypothetical protein